MISSIGKRQNKAFILLTFCTKNKQTKNKTKKAVTSNKTREHWCT